MKTKPMLLPQLRRFFLITTWFVASTATLALGTWLFFSQTASTSRLVKNLKLKTENSNYSLFAALPEDGLVLGQSITTGDARVVRLYNYLSQFGSPLAPYAQHLVVAADRYQLPWTLLPAIAGKESGYCRVIPYNSYNCWGWAVFSGQNSGAAWDSYEHAIETVAKGLRENYFDDGLDTIQEIETRYTPQSAARDNSWANDVELIMQEIENSN